MTDLLEDAGPTTDPTAFAATVWKQQNGRLWVGHRDGRCIGTIERGSRYVYVDLDANARCSHRTLADAQRLHSDPLLHCTPAPAPGRVPAAGRGPLVASAVAAVAMTVLFVITLLAVL